MREMYEGLRAVCAVLEDVEPCTPNARALRLAQRHLHLLAQLAAGRLMAVPDAPAGESGAPGALSPRLPALVEACHVVQ